MKTKFKNIGLIGTLILLGFTTTCWAQKKSKTVHEIFKVSNDVVIEVNTSYADIEFDTWNRNQVDIEAVVEIEGATEEELNDYLQNNPIKIIGNSRKIEISTHMEHHPAFAFNIEDERDVHFDFEHELKDSEDIEIIAPMIDFPEMVEVPPLPPLPPLPVKPFDYEAYKKDGEAYMNKWKSEFEAGFDKEYQKKMEEWGKRMELKQKEFEKKRMEMEVKRERVHQQRLEHIIERQEHQEQAKELRQQARDMQKGNRIIRIEIDTIGGENDVNREFIFYEENQHAEPNVFYSLKRGVDKKIKVKSTIKIKLPKSTQIKMNVRHGAVKLADNTNNLKATLAYTSLMAATIDGEKTEIEASYSPVSVQNWKIGQLKTDYSDKVNIKEAETLTLNANFSDVIIENLMNKAFIKNSFGLLTIKNITNNFTDLDIELRNAELSCTLPSTAYSISVNGLYSDLRTREGLKLQKIKNGNQTLHKGYYLHNKSGKSINIDAKYTDVVLR